MGKSKNSKFNVDIIKLLRDKKEVNNKQEIIELIDEFINIYGDTSKYYYNNVKDLFNIIKNYYIFNKHLITPLKNKQFKVNSYQRDMIIFFFNYITTKNIYYDKDNFNKIRPSTFFDYVLLHDYNLYFNNYQRLKFFRDIIDKWFL